MSSPVEQGCRRAWEGSTCLCDPVPAPQGPTLGLLAAQGLCPSTHQDQRAPTHTRPVCAGLVAPTWAQSQQYTAGPNPRLSGKGPAKVTVPEPYQPSRLELWVQGSGHHWRGTHTSQGPRD